MLKENPRETPKTRRELRREREKGKKGTLGKLLIGERRDASRLHDGRPGPVEYVREDGAPKRRRELRRERAKRERRGGFVEFFVTVAVALALVFGFVRPFIVEAFRIPSESMVPTLEVGDRVLANKFVYRFVEPERGDVVVFDSIGEENDDTLIKRVVGVAGDEVHVQGGLLVINGEARNEPYLNEQAPFTGFYGPITVPEDHVFVMGDNRSNSADSRVFGPVPIENLNGEAFARFWPIPEIGIL